MELSNHLDTLELLHTVGIKFTVLRENNSPIGLRAEINVLLAEQNQDLPAHPGKKDVKKPYRPHE